MRSAHILLLGEISNYNKTIIKNLKKFGKHDEKPHRFVFDQT